MTSKQKKRAAALLALPFALALAAGCAQAEPLASGPHPPVRLAAWAVSWDSEKGLGEYRQIKRRLAGISCFAAAYDAADRLAVPEETAAAARLAKKAGTARRYLTVTNDRQAADGKASVKDAALLQRLFATDESKDAAIREMMEAAHTLGCTGIELDYEAFWRDAPLREGYLDFTYRLFAACQKEQLALRIVLEPGMPFDGLCKGPEYVVMFYNLHGRHSGPGPKADRAFIEKTVQKMAAIPGKKGAAFATGGCIWEDASLLQKGTARFLDEQEATRLAAAHHAMPERDAESAALHFAYEEDGHRYEAWYADSETINAWITLAAALGIEDVSLWRLGGNTDIERIKTK